MLNPAFHLRRVRRAQSSHSLSKAPSNRAGGAVAGARHFRIREVKPSRLHDTVGTHVGPVRRDADYDVQDKDPVLPKWTVIKDEDEKSTMPTRFITDYIDSGTYVNVYAVYHPGDNG